MAIPVVVPTAVNTVAPVKAGRRAPSGKYLFSGKHAQKGRLCPNLPRYWGLGA